MPKPQATYAPTQRALHWVMAALIFALIGLGLYIPTIETPTEELKAWKMQVYDAHKWTGIVVLALALWRLRLRLRRPVAPAPGLTGWERRASSVTHRLLYALMIAMPLAGWASSSALGFPITLFGVLPLPDWVPVNTPLGFALLRVHQNLAWVMIGLVALHLGAVAMHRFVWRDGVLARMTGGQG